MQDILDVVVPARCALCGCSSARPVCDKCYALFEPIGEIYCSNCGKQTNVAVEKCRHCRGRRKSFSWHRSMFTYDQNMRSVIHKMKYFRRKDLAYFFGRSMFHASKGMLDGPYVVCGVPMSARRMRTREFDQVDLILRGFLQGYHEDVRSGIAPNCELIYRGRAIRKDRDTPFQHKLHKKDRIKNVRGMYEAKRRERGATSSAIIIDDVYTTGATINECALELRKVGYKQVVALTLARTPGIY